MQQFVNIQYFFSNSTKCLDIEPIAEKWCNIYDGTLTKAPI